MEQRKTKIQTLVICSVMVALSVALSFFTLWEMPMGGSVTPASMLPILLIGVMYGSRWGLGSAFVYSLFQLFQALIKGNVFVYCQTAWAIIICVLFDYIVPFGVLGLSGLFRKLSVGKWKHFGIYLGMTACVFVRFLCHFLTGITIWGQWDDGVWGGIIYSISYNGTYLLPDFLIAVAVGVLLIENKAFQRLWK
ncbi:MAG: energy-coupled thiamine transporter ThiT [Clostridia bacterium]|nr:energy-coupled thiamine transporter ThiT [Clostridia bacterium]